MPKIITFPPANAEAEAKLKRFLTNVGEFMDIELKPELVTLVSVEIPDDRQDVITVLNKISGAQQKKTRNGK